MRRRGIAYAVAWLAVALVGAAVFFHLRHQPFYFDASAYAQAAEGIRSGGLISDWPFVGLRTYGYPAVLAVALGIASATGVSPVAAIFGLQWLMFVGAAWFAVHSLFGTYRTRALGLIAVAANPLLVVYTPQALTESTTLVCLLLAVGALGRGVRARSFVGAGAWLAAGGAAAAYSLAVRPANILVPVVYCLAAVAALVWSTRPRSWLAVALGTLGVLVGIAAPLAPQLMVNWHNFHSASVLPATDIGSLQSDLGIQNLRYATNVAPCGDAGMPFPSPFVPSEEVDQSLRGMAQFYALTWPSGPETALMHIFSGLDPRPFLTYQVSFGVWYERLLQAFTLGLLSLASFAVSRVRLPRRWLRPDVLFLAMATLGSVAILAVSQAELRFGVVLVTAVSLAAAHGLARLRRPTPWQSITAIVVFVVALVLWFAVSDLVLATSDTWRACG